ncbi:hypothetical protein DPMN_068910 [Dreissena polymorpha]|uniref:Tyrosine-protein phosphatase domain-containing protein n=1 Tax=Dreissena polymorpha TaxID=45954 RepID=A0A9D3Z035_DREPO|nr:hypothetical protein DPMN_068910 [Dreissena polymorpha]
MHDNDFQDRETRTLTQLHFTSWPDKDVPESVTSLIEFRKNVIRAPATLGGPIIVHCRYIMCWE